MAKSHILVNTAIVVATVLLGFWMTVWLDNNNTPPVPDTNQAQQIAPGGDKVPTFSFTAMDGKNYTITDFKGPVILNFWATWCAPCLIEFPKLIDVARTNPDLTIIALSSDSEDATLKRFLIKHKIPKNMIIARDNHHKITGDLFQTFKLPESIIIDTKGHMVKKIAGDTDWLGPEMTTFLKNL